MIRGRATDPAPGERSVGMDLPTLSPRRFHVPRSPGPLVPAGIAALLLAGLSAVPLAAQCSPPVSGLVSWWRFGGDALDAVGGNHGTASGGAAYAAGTVGQALALDGADDYVVVPDHSSLRLTTAVTIESWVRRQSTSGIDFIAQKGGDWTNGATNYGLTLHDPSQGNRMYFTFAGGGRFSVPVADNVWHHVAVTAVHGATDPIFYLDGVAQSVFSSFGGATINLNPSTHDLHIGAQVGGYYAHLEIDELSIYDRVLTASEIAAIHAAGAAGKCTSSAGTIGVGTNPRDVAVADLQGDGSLDLVTADEGDDTLSVVYGDGTGAFATRVVVALGGGDDSPVSVALCDLDDDGDADDAAVACEGSSTVALVTNLAGAPTVVSHTSLGLRCVHVAAGDLDADGRDDVVVAREGELLLGGGGVEVLLNGTSPVTLPGSAATRVVRVGICDLDGDLDNDIVAVAHGAADEILLYANDGAGTFTLAGSLLPGSSGLTYGLCCGDLDGDGDADFAVTVSTLFPTPSQELRVFLYTGSGALDPSDYTALAGIASTGSFGLDLSCGDFEDDGIPLFSSAFDVTVVNAGSGDLTSHHGFSGSGFGSTSAPTGGTNPVAAVMADFNGDGCDDLVVCNQGGGDLTVTLTVPPALAQTYGTGCAGTGALVPAIGAQNLPTSGATDFAVLLSNARANSLAVLLFGLDTANTSLGGGCLLLVAPPVQTVLRFTSGLGAAFLPLGIPVDPSLQGFDACFQWAVFDPNGAFAATLAISDALRVQIGQ